MALSRPATRIVRLDEPLVESAPLQWELAERSCLEACRWYHGPRLYLRALGIQIGVQNDTAFLLDVFTRLAVAGRYSRVLITGAADYSMLAHVIAAYQAAGVDLTAAMVDRCATPLAMNAWYARRMGVRFDMLQGDVFEVPAAGPFDLVCTHSFLPRFDPDGRQRLAARWYELLRPGGALVTANALRPAARDLYTPDVHAGAAAMRERAREAGKRARMLFALDEATINDCIERLIERSRPYPIRSTEEVGRLLGHAGFESIEFGDETASSSSAALRRLRVLAFRKP